MPAELTTHVLTKTHARAHVLNSNYISLYNEERRLGDQRGSDTLVVPLITSNDGLSIALSIRLELHLDLNLLNLIKYYGLSS